MEDLIGIALLLLIFVALPGVIFYTNARYRRRRKEAGLAPTHLLSNKYATLDLFRSSKSSLTVFAFIMVVFGVFVAFTGLPYAGIGFVLMFGTFLVGRLCGLVPMPSSTPPLADSMAESMAQINAYAESQRKKVSPAFRRTFIAIAVVAVCLMAYQFIALTPASPGGIRNYLLFQLL